MVNSLGKLNLYEYLFQVQTVFKLPVGYVTHSNNAVVARIIRSF